MRLGAPFPPQPLRGHHTTHRTKPAEICCVQNEGSFWEGPPPRSAAGRHGFSKRVPFGAGTILGRKPSLRR
jgi:hypothetical protein